MIRNSGKLVIEKNKITAWSNLFSQEYCNEKILTKIFELTKEQANQILILIFEKKYEIKKLNQDEVTKTINQLCN
jgi:type III secretory pathway lipoprotein EscJ